MSAESAPQPEVEKFEIGDKSYAIGDMVKVSRNSGESEDDWVFMGFNVDGGVEVCKSDGNDTLRKSASKEKFILWQEDKKKFEIGGKSYEIGDRVRVTRSSGEVEDDWQFMGFIPDGGIEVKKADGDRLLRKPVSKEDFIRWQEASE